jgi:hypothetical protein
VNLKACSGGATHATRILADYEDIHPERKASTG